jgi:hypothetical protein
MNRYFPGFAGQKPIHADSGTVGAVHQLFTIWGLITKLGPEKALRGNCVSSVVVFGRQTHPRLASIPFSPSMSESVSNQIASPSPDNDNFTTANLNAAREEYQSVTRVRLDTPSLCNPARRLPQS